MSGVIRVFVFYRGLGAIEPDRRAIAKKLGVDEAIVRWHSIYVAPVPIMAASVLHDLVKRRKLTLPDVLLCDDRDVPMETVKAYQADPWKYKPQLVLWRMNILQEELQPA